MAAVVAPFTQTIEPFVVKRAEFFRALFIFPNPFREFEFEFGELGLRGERLVVVDDATCACAIWNFVIDDGRA